MNDRKLFEETFSAMHVSEKTISEVIEKAQHSSARKIIRLPRAVSLAACLVLVVGLAIAVSAAANGGVIQHFTDYPEHFQVEHGSDLREIEIFNEYRSVYTAEDGTKTYTYHSGFSIYNTDSRLILQVWGGELDITDELNQQGSYLYERTIEKATLRVEVTGSSEQWTATGEFRDEQRPSMNYISTWSSESKTYTTIYHPGEDNEYSSECLREATGEELIQWAEERGSTLIHYDDNIYPEFMTNEELLQWAEEHGITVTIHDPES